ncbi:MAG: thioredoxin family protein [Ginsengibacter sp.]
MTLKNLSLKLLVVSIFLLGESLGVSAQRHINFQNLTFDQAMAKAAKTNQIIFVDVRGMNINLYNQKVENQIFTIDSIADFFNKHCIPIHVDMSGEEGKKFAPRLAMLMYPVYAFYDKDGNQLDFISASQILKDTSSLMVKAGSSLTKAEIKVKNKRHIVFDDASWKAVLAKAKSEHKLVFLDAYTTWCRPCIQMAKDVFTLDKVADFYNKNFVNVSMDMDKGEGPSIVKQYKISAYPDFLFIDGDGHLVHRGGGYQEAPEFINLGKSAVKAQKDMSHANSAKK